MAGSDHKHPINRTITEASPEYLDILYWAILPFERTSLKIYAKEK